MLLSQETNGTKNMIGYRGINKVRKLFYMYVNDNLMFDELEDVIW